MKKILFSLAAIIMLTACDKYSEDYREGTKFKTFTFAATGDFTFSGFTRGDLTASDNTMTDLWVFDCVEGECVQSIHQVNTDDGWGRPQMNLAYGEHQLFFVASRGVNPTVDESANTIVWDNVRDTFWKGLDLEVTSTSSGNVSVTLERVVTNLKIAVLDKVPTGLASISITPKTWYYGINYANGIPVNAKTNQEKVISVPSSYIGTTGNLTTSIFSFSGTDEWTTDVGISAKDGSGNVISSVSIENAPFRRNRITQYSGNLFNISSVFSLSVDDGWTEALEGTW